MLRNLFPTFIAAALAAGVFTAGAAHAADQSVKKTVTVPMTKTSPVSGKQMYASYCASCHGVSGKGDGPVAASLKARPADLTVLSRNNGGKYPSSHVATVLQLGADVPSHGTSTMPVWGPLLGKMDRANPEQRALRVANLSHYVETMQAK